jgi:hypothetical protein
VTFVWREARLGEKGDEMNALDELLEIAKVNNWDGFGSRQVIQAVADNCKTLLAIFLLLRDKPFELTATLNGTVYLSWEEPDAGIEIGKSRVSAYFTGSERVFVDCEIKCVKN